MTYKIPTCHELFPLFIDARDALGEYGHDSGKIIVRRDGTWSFDMLNVEGDGITVDVDIYGDDTDNDLRAEIADTIQEIKDAIEMESAR